MKIAAIADIHGNLAALEAVLAEIQRHAPDLIVNLGDSLSGPLFPAECADLLLSCNISAIKGNHERQLLTLPVGAMGESDQYAASCLQPHHLRWIEKTPETLLIEGEILLVHGTPRSDLEYYLETVEQGAVRAATPQEVEERTRGAHASLIFCGHTHIPRRFTFADQRVVVNPGSVGLPAYEDDRPFPHKMQSASPHARYALVEKRGKTWSATLRSTVYDWELAARVAESRGRRDWAAALRTGLI
ncbi:metallophosphoesterase [Terriglobus sp. RCC_193]|uniref:metallophosphoesterase family protein n=1 Tax=Terriglobus sp. RCC_193 TaxID=3239218 RepID=UPI003526548E